MNQLVIACLFGIAATATCSAKETVIVTDAATGKPLAGAEVIVGAPSFNSAPVLSGADGKAVVSPGPLDTFVQVTKPGFIFEVMHLPTKWPIKVSLSPEKK